MLSFHYSKILDSLGVTNFATLYCTGKSLTEVCPKKYLQRFLCAKEKIKAYKISLVEAKVNPSIPLERLIPNSILSDYLNVQNLICEHILKTYPKPENYDFLLDATRLLYDISTKKVNFGNNSFSYCKYNLFGSKTGRLTTKKNSFPILTLKREERVKIYPNNDLFITMDYNSAELRMLNYLLGKKNNISDLHAWNARNIFPMHTTRDEAKKQFFVWLYNPECHNEALGKEYKRDELLAKYFDGEQIKTPFNRVIKCDRFHALNYIIQSSLADMFMQQAIKIFKKLQGRKSYISFLIHDSLTIDSHQEDKEILKECVDIFQDTCYDKFIASVKIGKNLGELK